MPFEDNIFFCPKIRKWKQKYISTLACWSFRLIIFSTKNCIFGEKGKTWDIIISSVKFNFKSEKVIKDASIYNFSGYNLYKH